MPLSDFTLHGHTADQALDLLPQSGPLPLCLVRHLPQAVQDGADLRPGVLHLGLGLIDPVQHRLDDGALAGHAVPVIINGAQAGILTATGPDGQSVSVALCYAEPAALDPDVKITPLARLGRLWTHACRYFSSYYYPVS